MSNLKTTAKQLAQKGRNGDTLLAHITPEEANLLEMLGGSGTINPNTGLPEFWGLGGFFRAITNPIQEIVNTVGDIGQGAIDTVSNAGSSVDDFVNDEVPGGWKTVAAIAAPYVAPELAAAEAVDTPVFSEIMELPTDQLLSEYAAATSAVPAAIETVTAPTVTPEPVLPDLPPVQDLSEVVPGVVSDGSALTGALAGGVAGAAAGDLLEGLLIPDIPAAPKVEKKTYTPNYDLKFDNPQSWKLLDRPEFQLSNTVTNPYLTKAQNSPVIGRVLGAGSGPYKSNLIAALRDASATPAWVNPGFVSFQSK